MIRRPPRSTLDRSSAASDVYKRQVYTGASAETVRGFLTTPIERVVSAISGVDYIESESRQGVSTITVHLKLNHNSTAALAEITARLHGAHQPVGDLRDGPLGGGEAQVER